MGRPTLLEIQQPIMDAIAAQKAKARLQDIFDKAEALIKTLIDYDLAKEVDAGDLGFGAVAELAIAIGHDYDEINQRIFGEGFDYDGD